MKIFITGGAGFIGSNFVRYMVKTYPQHDFINYDKLTYAGDLRNVKEVENEKNYSFVKGDVCDFERVKELLNTVDVVIHLAAESHVDNSIGNSLIFTQSNTYGTHVLLEAARLNNIKRFVHVSTDEVYGDIEKGSFSEDAMLNPNNPYSASKAGAEMIARSYFKTYKVPIVMVRGNNVFGPCQHPEKLIPMCITKTLLNKKISLHGDGSPVRTFIYAEDFATALDTVFRNGKEGETYNIGTDDEIKNLDVAKLILTKMGKPTDSIEFVKDRPFNDTRYSINLDKIHSLGWKKQYSFEKALDKTVEWYKKNNDWWMDKIKQ